jgi:hypothetical protein
MAAIPLPLPGGNNGAGADGGGVAASSCAGLPTRVMVCTMIGWDDDALACPSSYPQRFDAQGPKATAEASTQGPKATTQGSKASTRLESEDCRPLVYVRPCAAAKATSLFQRLRGRPRRPAGCGSGVLPAQAAGNAPVGEPRPLGAASLGVKVSGLTSSDDDAGKAGPNAAAVAAACGTGTETPASSTAAGNSCKSLATCDGGIGSNSTGGVM